MDRLELGEKIKDWFGKYRYGLLVVALGIFLMVLPAGEKQKTETVAPPILEKSLSLDEELAEILTQIRGVGRVKVMLTEATGAETVYQTDTDKSESAETSSVRVETVIISGSGAETGLVKTVTPPVYLGAIVVCQGGDDPTVRLAVAQAVSVVTGISTDRITVLKMK